MPSLFDEYDLKKKKQESLKVDDAFYQTYVVVDTPHKSLNVYPYKGGIFFKVDSDENVEILPKDKFDEELQKVAAVKRITSKVVDKLNPV